MKNYFTYWPMAAISQCMKVIVYVTIDANLFLEKYETTTLWDKIFQYQNHFIRNELENGKELFFLIPSNSKRKNTGPND